MSDVLLQLKLPEDQILQQLEPQIQAEVQKRYTELDIQIAAIRSAKLAIDDVIRAVDRVEDSRNSRDEQPSIQNLVKAAAKLRRLFEAYRKGL